MQTRVFNQVEVDYQQKILTKTSINTAKLKNEINFYLDLPENIQHLFPKLLSHQSDFSSYQIEYIPYQNIAELLLNDELDATAGKNMITRLMAILIKIHQAENQNNISKEIIQQFYQQKTSERIQQLKTDDHFSTLLTAPVLIINGENYHNFCTFEQAFNTAIQHFAPDCFPSSIIHGDFCLSNILYCKTTHQVKLIDPRGAFGQKGIYGHSYYDYAKLLHCLHGRYDDIIRGNFELHKLTDDRYQFTLQPNALIAQLTQHYYQLLTQQGIHLNLLHLIEASLFLSMAALHYDDRQRQRAFYLNGIIILNQFFKGDYENLY